MASKSQKLRGYPLPTIIAPEGTRQFCLTIPDDEAYYQAVVGQLTMLGKWWLWKHNQDPTNPEAVFTSEVWRQVYLLEEGGCGTMPIDCGEIEDCIETSPTIQEIEDTQAAGYNAANASIPVNTGKNSSVLSQDVYTPANACDDSDKDALWSAINSLIDFWHSRNLQLLNEFTGASSLTGVINTLLSTIPIYAILNDSIKNSFASWLITQAKSAYETQVNSAVLYEIKCQLFCDSVDNGCELDMQQVMEDFLSKGLPMTLTDTIVDFFTDLATFNGTTAEEWFASIAILQGALATLGETSVSTVGLQSFLQAAAAGAAAPNNAWKAYCDECASPSGWIAVFDFKGDYVSADPDEIVYRPAFNWMDWGANSPTATFEAILGTGIKITHPGNSNATRRLISFAANTNIHDVEYRGYAPATGGRISIQSSVIFAWAIPSPVAESGIIGGGLIDDSLDLVFGNGTDNDWVTIIEWIKFREDIGNPLPPPKPI